MAAKALYFAHYACCHRVLGSQVYYRNIPSMYPCLGVRWQFPQDVGGSRVRFTNFFDQASLQTEISTLHSRFLEWIVAMAVATRSLSRSRDDRVLAGVMGGIARRFGWNSTLVRVVFVIVSVLSAAFPGILVYLALWLLIPQDPL
jgi:phage shock protein C